MTGTLDPFQTVHTALQVIDSSLKEVGLAAEAVHTSFSPLPPVVSDYDKDAPSSSISKGIDAVRAQVRRGLPIAAHPMAFVVRMPTSLPLHLAYIIIRTPV